MSAAAPSRRPRSTPPNSTTVVAVELGRHTCWLQGPGDVIHGAIRAACSPREYDKQRRAIAIPRRYADDVLAALELQWGVELDRRQVVT